MSQNYKTEQSHYTIHREMKDEVTGEERKAEKRRGGKEMRGREREGKRIIYATE